VLSVKSVIKWLFSISLFEVVVLCLIVSFQFINLESTITLFVFNFFFASLIFLLNGTVNKKLGMLAVGNVVGLFWNMAFHYFSSAGTLYFGETFEVLYTVTYPMLNLMWVVPFFSLSLCFLPKPQNAGEEAKSF